MKEIILGTDFVDNYGLLIGIYRYYLIDHETY